MDKSLNLSSILNREAAASAEDPAPVVKKKPEKKAEKQPEQPTSDGIDPRLAELTSNYIRKVRLSSEQLQSEDIIEMVALIVSAFGETSEHRLEILKAVKHKTIR